LEVSPDATTAQIDDAYRKLARSAHPDAGGSHDQMARLNAARDVAKAQGR
jgi:curved DNA-binding protein CbpA